MMNHKTIISLGYSCKNIYKITVFINVDYKPYTFSPFTNIQIWICMNILLCEKWTYCAAGNWIRDVSALLAHISYYIRYLQHIYITFSYFLYQYTQHFLPTGSVIQGPIK
jgi:hypothetical protein